MRKVHKMILGAAAPQKHQEVPSAPPLCRTVLRDLEIGVAEEGEAAVGLAWVGHLPPRAPKRSLPS